MREGLRSLRGGWLPAILLWVVALGVTGVFVWIVGDIAVQGGRHLSWEFLSTEPSNAGRSGGILPILVSTVLVLGVCGATVMPVGIGTAVFLSQRGQSLPVRLVRRSLDVLSGVPSVVFGLFGNAVFCKFMGMGFSIMAGGLTLACMVFPILTRMTEEAMRTVPQSYLQGAAALSLSRTTTLWRIVLPAAAPGIAAGMALGIGRAVAETAALLFTSGYVDRMPESLLDSGRVMSIHILDLTMNISGGNDAAYGTATVLIGLIVLLNAAAWTIARSWHHGG